ncbi:MAG: co-chaperone GroES [Actinobacteria bacterium]|nr:co-chaperone GroES [Cyanobacteriota bacterium]MCL5772459.1 co-chaperone GroES [Actinomycetota bacterium]
MKKIQPVNNNVLIKLDESKEEKTSGGIVLPDSAKTKSNEGVIIAIAAGASEEISIGDRVIYKEYSGTEIKFEGEKYILIPAADIYAKYIEGDSI